MELRHLRYFIVLAEELHFGRAAARLGIAQPPLSQQIKSLEQELGAPLLARTKRRVELTPAGAAFLAEARKTLEQAERARQAAQRAARGEMGQLTVGFVSSAVYGGFPEIFHQMRQRYPDIALGLQDLSSEEQVEAMRAGRLDVGVIRPPVAGCEALSLRVLWREPFVIALPRGHRLARQKQIALADLRDEPFLQVPRRFGPGFYDEMMRICAAAGFAPRVVQEARSTQTLVSLVSGGMGISMVPASLQSYQRAGVAYRPLRPPVPMTELAVIWPPSEPAPALRSFLKIVWEMAGVAAESSVLPQK